jgi:hypothetical protein
MMNELEEMPRDTVGFIDVLDQMYPHRCIRKDEEIIEHHRYAAIRELIDELLIIKQEILDGETDDNS